MTKKYSTFYSNSKVETINNESDINDIFESIYTTIISNMQKFIGKSSGWITDWFIFILLIFENAILWLTVIISNYQKNWTIQKRVWLILKILMVINFLNDV